MMSFMHTLLCLVDGGKGGEGSNCKFLEKKNPQVHLIILIIKRMT